LVLCNYVFNRLVGDFDCLISFLHLIFVLWLTWLLTMLMCSFCPWPRGAIQQ
jgi:hypothetical protein